MPCLSLRQCLLQGGQLRLSPDKMSQAPGFSGL